MGDLDEFIDAVCATLIAMKDLAKDLKHKNQVMKEIAQMECNRQLSCEACIHDIFVTPDEYCGPCLAMLTLEREAEDVHGGGPQCS